jgi:hypothetical protein
MGGTSHLEAKLLYRRLDSLLGGLDLARPARKVMSSFLDEAFRTLKDDLRLKAAVLYREGRDEFAFVKSVGDLKVTPPEALDPATPPASLVLQHGVYIFPDSAPRHAEPGRHPARGPAALLAVGSEELPDLHPAGRRLGARLTSPSPRCEHRAPADRAEEGRSGGRRNPEEPAPRQAPGVPRFELAARSVPAEEVGGDSSTSP